MRNKWVIGINIFAILLLAVFGVLPFILVIIESGSISRLFTEPPSLISILLSIFFALGFLKRKNWVRIIFLWVFWITAISAAVGGCGLAGDIFGALSIMIIPPAIALMITFFLTHPKIREQFKQS